MQKLLLISVIDQSAQVVIKTLENIRQEEETDWARKRPSWAVCREGGGGTVVQPSSPGAGSSRSMGTWSLVETPQAFAAAWGPGNLE